MDTAPTPLPDNRCIGSLCPKHPWLGGLRRKRNRECIQCRQEYRQEWKTRPEIKASIAQSRRDRREMGKVAVALAKKEYDEVRVRACHLAAKATGNEANWQDYFQEAKETLDRG